MSRTSAPPSSDDSSTRLSLVMAWYRGGVNFSDDGRFTQSCTPCDGPPLRNACSDGTSSWRMPPPAVIHCVSPSLITPPPPLESWCEISPSSTYVTVSKPRWGCHGAPFASLGP